MPLNLAPDKLAVSQPFRWLGVVGFFWFCLTGFWGADGHLVALGLMILAFAIWVRSNWPLLRRSSLFWLAASFAVFVVIRAAISAWGDPASSWAVQVKWVTDLLWASGIAAIFLIPWQLGRGREKRLDWAFGLVVFSLFIQVGLHMDWAHLGAFLLDRPWFQMNPNAFGAIAGVLVLGTLVVGLRLVWACSWSLPRWGQYVVWVIWGLALVGLMGGLVVSQSRASWLAAVVTIPSALAVMGFFQTREGWLWRRTTVVGIAVFGLVAGGLVYSQWGLVENRILTQHETVAKALSLEFSDLPTNSVGRRLQLYGFGLRHIWERPLVGWSPGEVEGLIARRGGEAISHLTYMHNMPLQIGMQLGLVGLAWFFGMVVLSAREVWWASQAGRLPFEWGVFWLGALGFLAVEGMFDSPFHHNEFQFLLLFLGAVAMGTQVERLRQEHETLPLSHGTMGNGP